MTSSTFPLFLVFVVVQSTAAIFITEPENKVIKRGSSATVSFQCATDVQNPVYTWRKDDEKLDTSDSSKYKLYGGTLDILTPTESDAGKYQCVLRSEDGIVVSNYGELIIAYINPFPVAELDPISKYAGAGVKIPCAGADYEPKDQVLIYWEAEGQFNRLLNGNKTFYISPTDGALYFSNLKIFNSDLYWCTARSKWPGSRGSPIEERGNAVKLNVGAANALESPEFLLNPTKNVFGVLGGELRMECFASGNPAPDITWTKQGSSLPVNHSITESGQLILKNINRDMAGTYVCQASNSEDTISGTSTLQLQYMPQWVDEITSRSIDLSSRDSIRCEATAEPKARYVWLKDGVKITPEMERFSVVEDGDGSRLEINEAAKEDDGMYQCIAINEHGNLFSSAKITVVSKPPKFVIRVPDKTEVFRGSEAEIKCVVEAAPKAVVTWKKDDNKLSLDEARLSMKPEGSLVISNVTDEDGGRYTCDAENEIGSISSQGSLKLFDPTVITQGPENLQMLMGDDDSLFCECDYDQELRLRWVWKQDGKNLTLSNHYNVLGNTLKLMDVTSKQTGTYECCAYTITEVCESASVTVRAPPDRPTKIRVKSSTATTQVLEWKAPNSNGAEITRYVVEGNNQYEKNWVLMRTDPETVNTSSCVVNTLLAYNQYRYRVAGVNSIGTGRFSKASEFVKTGAASPSVSPKNVSGGGGTPGQLIVTWEPLNIQLYGADDIWYMISYRKKPLEDPNKNQSDVNQDQDGIRWIERKIDGGKSHKKILQVEETEINVAYEVKIKAVNDVGPGPWSPVSVVHTAELAPTTSPSGFKTVKVQAETAVISWDELLDPNGRTKGYYVSVCEILSNCDVGPNQINLTTPNEKPVIEIPQLEAKHSYSLKAAGFNLGGVGPWSNVFIFDTPGPPPDVAPTNVKINVKDQTLTAKWDSVKSEKADNPVLGYWVEFWLMNETVQEADHKASSVTEIQFELPAKASYYVWVRAHNAGGPGRPSAKVAVSTELGTSAKYEGDFANSLQSSFLLIVSSILMWLVAYTSKM